MDHTRKKNKLIHQIIEINVVDSIVIFMETNTTYYCFNYFGVSFQSF